MTPYDSYVLERRSARLMHAAMTQPLDLAVLLVVNHVPAAWRPPTVPRLLDVMTAERYLTMRAEDAILKSLQFNPAVMERGS